MSDAGKILSGPAGYALVLGGAALLVYLVYRQIKAPFQAVYNGAQNFDQNIGLGSFDAWVSGLFSAPTPSAANLGGQNFGAVDPSTWNGP